MPPVVTGAVVAVIGLNLAPIAVKSIAGSTLRRPGSALATVVAIGLVAVRAPGLARRLPILLGAIAGYVAVRSARQRHGAGQGHRLRRAWRRRRWFGMPRFIAPQC